ncbi:hypothetical protein D1B31_08360 [Neobacillus notoginsengisoli]|uniref:DUF2154 domain-containing protein n=1 Tax=Neobacillus notoginsengisoli TaxID=1578198 RepID=A0A417YWB8_9BACI|nr:toast rack family protein [Neobacillus notoginsengisoli]RHW41713.1 hypothetical protein D1B31_08360 [Neobacillus notoginsengisoli]
MKKLVGALVIAAVLIFAARFAVGAIMGGNNESDIHVDKDKAKNLEVALDIGVSKLTVTGGADDWLEGTIHHEGARYKPVVSYKRLGKEGRIKVTQEKKRLWNFHFGKEDNDWKIALTDDVPIDLKVDAGVSDATLDLRGMKLSSLDVDAGVGDVEINLAGEWDEGFQADVQMGVGKTTVILPKDIGVKVIADKGIGKVSYDGFIKKNGNVYVNEAFESAKKTIIVNADLGIGDVKFKVK